MKTMYDIRTLLKKYGIFIYTGNKMGDVELMEIEIRDLYHYHMIDKDIFLQAIVLLHSEKNKLV